MQVAVRSYLTAGVALVGASVIAVTPIAPLPADIQIPNPAVQLAATPFDIYVQVFQEAVANAGVLLDEALADPAPILGQLLANQIATVNSLAAGLVTTAGATFTALTTVVPPLLQAAFNDLISGDVEGAVNNLLTAALATVLPLAGLVGPIQAAIAQPVQNLLNVIDLVDPTTVSLALVGLLGPDISGVGAIGTAVQNVIGAVGNGDLEQVLGAVIAGPAVVADGFLNGGYGPNLGSLVGASPESNVLAGGILSSPGFEPPNIVNLPGGIATLLGLRLEIADAITPTTMLSATNVTTTNERLVAVDVTPEPVAVDQEPAVVTAKGSGEVAGGAVAAVGSGQVLKGKGPVVKTIKSLIAKPGQNAKIGLPGQPVKKAVKGLRTTVKQVREQVKKVLGGGGADQAAEK